MSALTSSSPGSIRSSSAQEEVDPWSGEESVPLWLPRPAYDGMLAHDATPSLDNGLSVRPVAETARDTLAWLQLSPDAHVTGIGLEREAELLTGRGNSLRA